MKLVVRLYNLVLKGFRNFKVGHLLITVLFYCSTDGDETEMCQPKYYHSGDRVALAI